MKQTLSDWMRDHWFGIVTLISMVVGFAMQYGVQSYKEETLATRADKQAVTVDALLAIDAERRLGVLEKRTDDVETLKIVTSMQGDQIKSVVDAMKSDHDILIRIVASMDAKK